MASPIVIRNYAPQSWPFSALTHLSLLSDEFAHQYRICASWNAFQFRDYSTVQFFFPRLALSTSPFTSIPGTFHPRRSSLFSPRCQGLRSFYLEFESPRTHSRRLFPLPCSVLPALMLHYRARGSANMWTSSALQPTYRVGASTASRHR